MTSPTSPLPSPPSLSPGARTCTAPAIGRLSNPVVSTVLNGLGRPRATFTDRTFTSGDSTHPHGGGLRVVAASLLGTGQMDRALPIRPSLAPRAPPVRGLAEHHGSGAGRVRG